MITKYGYCFGLAVIGVTLLFLVGAGGCWDKREAEDLGYVRGTMIDRVSDHRVRVMAQVPNPRALGGAGMGGLTPGASTSAKSYQNLEAEGESIFDAVRRLALQSPLRLFWAQNVLVIFTERTARQGLDGILDFLERSTEIRRRLNYILLTPSNPDVLLDIPSPHDPIPALRIHRIIELHPQSSRFAPVTLGEFLQMLATEGQDPYCAVLRAVANPARDPTGQHPQAPESKLTVKLSGAAAFRGDRLVGYLSERETRGLLWAQNRFKGGAITVPVPGGGRATLEVVGAKGRIVPQMRDGRPVAEVEVTGVRADVTEVDGSFDLTRPEAVQKLNGLLAAAIERDVLATVQRAQALGTDVLGVGAAFHRRLPQEWKGMKEDWSQIFPTVEITVRAKASVHRTGFIQKGVPIWN